jgi:hypothetical protein
MSALREILASQWRLLTFRSVRPDLARHRNAYVAYGLIVTALAGFGRYWDNPKADTWQLLGLGSVAYVFVLALLLWLVVKPLAKRPWSYTGVLVFVMLTSLPALLYAIPVEKFMSLRNAQQANVWFLATVASWRVILLVLFLRRAAGLGALAIVAAALLPLVLIIVTLAVLNLEHVVFNIMAGIRPEAASGNDAAYQVVVMLAVFSFFSLPFVGGLYLALALNARGWLEQFRESNASRRDRSP